VSVYRLPKLAPQLLYALLEERKPDVNISHRAMPTWKQHIAFIAGRPYTAWYLIRSQHNYVGAIYLTAMNEIGISILKRWRSLDFGPRAIQLLMRKYGRKRYLANINPRNHEWIEMFGNLGFRVIQQTFELRT
jgi:hypothetical protein